MKFYVASERLFFNKDKTKIVKHGDREAWSLFLPVGGKCPMDIADRYGLIEQFEETTSTEDKETTISKEDAMTAPLKKLNSDELRAIASVFEIENIHDLTKKELIAAIEEKRQSEGNE